MKKHKSISLRRLINENVQPQNLYELSEICNKPKNISSCKWWWMARLARFSAPSPITYFHMFPQEASTFEVVLASAGCASDVCWMQKQTLVALLWPLVAGFLQRLQGLCNSLFLSLSLSLCPVMLCTNWSLFKTMYPKTGASNLETLVQGCLCKSV